MITGSIARRYAKALLGIGVETNQHDRFGQELSQFAKLLDNKDLRETLANPSYPLSRRKAILDQLVSRVGPSKAVGSFLLLLCDRGRLAHLPGIAREYQNMVDTHVGRVRANVASAEQLDATAVTRLQQALEQKTGKQVVLRQTTDPELIAGMVTQIGSVVYDGSVRTRLHHMRQTLLAGE